MATGDGLTVAVTGPTGDLGIAVVSRLERSPRVKRIVGMARRPFDPAVRGWRKTEYRQGDVQDRRSVRETVKGADAVVHLAFAILGEG
ncbi:MAG TPA: NAD-dependent epimerase/dehydratase family protein, partial [Thermoleophilaceae bacterium]|nr:NAD-dependent epimerase/dehydratase family protein [Thermoleophilaceae bacterium]